MAAGADGLERQLDPGTEAVGDQYGDPGAYPALPATFADGLAAFRGSRLAAMLGTEFGVNFEAMMSHELALFEEHTFGSGGDDVTDWEFARYVEFS